MSGIATFRKNLICFIFLSLFVAPFAKAEEEVDLSLCTHAQYPAVCIGLGLVDKLDQILAALEPTSSAASSATSSSFQLQSGIYYRLDSQGKEMFDKENQGPHRDEEGRLIRKIAVRTLDNGDQEISYHGNQGTLWGTFRCRSDLNVCYENNDRALLTIASPNTFSIGWHNLNAEGQATPSSVFTFKEPLTE